MFSTPTVNDHTTMSATKGSHNHQVWATMAQASTFEFNSVDVGERPR